MAEEIPRQADLGPAFRAMFANSGRYGQAFSNHSVRGEILQTVSAEFSSSEKSPSCTTDFCLKIHVQTALLDRWKAAQQFVFRTPHDPRRFARIRRSCVRFPSKCQ